MGKAQSKMAKSKSKFDYMPFEGGADGEQFVVHANKYTQEQALELFAAEYPFDDLRRPTIEDMQMYWVKWYIRLPDDTFNEFPDGGYSFCAMKERGSFPAWVITLNTLRDLRCQDGAGEEQ